jgi:hypothetical protein
VPFWLPALKRAGAARVAIVNGEQAETKDGLPPATSSLMQAHDARTCRFHVESFLRKIRNKPSACSPSQDWVEKAASAFWLRFVEKLGRARFTRSDGKR